MVSGQWSGEIMASRVLRTKTRRDKGVKHVGDCDRIPSVQQMEGLVIFR